MAPLNSLLRAPKLKSRFQLSHKAFLPRRSGEDSDSRLIKVVTVSGGVARCLESLPGLQNLGFYPQNCTNCNQPPAILGYHRGRQEGQTVRVIFDYTEILRPTLDAKGGNVVELSSLQLQG